MNDAEQKIFRKYQALGYDIIHVGVPDFLLLRNGEIKFIEVKSPKDHLSREQEQCIEVLEEHGFKVLIEAPDEKYAEPIKRPVKKTLSLPINNTRMDIFMTLVNEARPMGLTEIAESLDITHQLVDYHTDLLLDLGLILFDSMDRKYMCQPVFIDPDIQQGFLEAYTDAFSTFIGQLILDEFETEKDRRQVLMNIGQVQAMLMFGQLKTLIDES